MKKNLRRLQWAARLFGEENFYTTRAYKDKVVLQGRFDVTILAKAEKLNFEHEVKDNGYVKSTRKKQGVIYQIVLT